jgi:hypothetical protein
MNGTTNYILSKVSLSVDSLSSAVLPASLSFFSFFTLSFPGHFFFQFFLFTLVSPLAYLTLSFLLSSLTFLSSSWRGGLGIGQWAWRLFSFRSRLSRLFLFSSSFSSFLSPDFSLLSSSPRLSHLFSFRSFPLSLLSLFSLFSLLCSLFGLFLRCIPLTRLDVGRWSQRALTTPSSSRRCVLVPPPALSHPSPFLPSPPSPALSHPIPLLPSPPSPALSHPFPSPLTPLSPFPYPTFALLHAPNSILPSLSHRRSFSFASARTHAHTHTHTHTRPRTWGTLRRTHTHTHTHTPGPGPWVR